MQKERYLFTSESVTEAHPDKLCDKISDAILDECIKQDPNSRVAIETLVTTGLCVIAGEVTTKGWVNFDAVARETIKEIGYDSGEKGFDSQNVAVLAAVHAQSPDIAQGVNEGEGEFKEQGAGDQGLMFGYACDETPEFMPLSTVLAHRLTEKLTDARKKNEILGLFPDGKSQVTVEYKDGKPFRVDAIVIAAHHSEKTNLDFLRTEIRKKVIDPVCAKWIDANTKFFINSTGRFVLGGPAADSGVTGRKIIVDTYGGHSSHGGGAFSGKDPSKVDRSAAYLCRYIAKNIVAAGLAKRCEVQLAYAIGVAEPVSVLVNTFETATVSEADLESAVRKVFPLKPAQIIKELNLLRPIYKKTAAYGHFGRNDPDFTWEKTDKTDELKKLLKK